MLARAAFVGLLGLASLISPNAAMGAHCFKYEPALVTISGTISVREDYGPPNYGEDPAHDSRESHLYIALDNPLCVDAGDESGPNAEAESNVKSMEMVYFKPFQNRWLGRQVLVEGTLFHAFSGHHHTPVLIRVKTARLLKRAQNSN